MKCSLNGLTKLEWQKHYTSIIVWNLWLVWNLNDSLNYSFVFHLYTGNAGMLWWSQTEFETLVGSWSFGNIQLQFWPGSQGPQVLCHHHFHLHILTQIDQVSSHPPSTTCPLWPHRPLSHVIFWINGGHKSFVIMRGPLDFTTHLHHILNWFYI